MRQGYQHQVRLLLQILPFIGKAEVFALKGGTAINFFVRDFPRLSVDIDLTYLPVKNRKDSLKEISQGVQLISQEIEKRMPDTTVSTRQSGGALSKILIRREDAQIKVEVNTVLRGSIFESVEMELSPNLQQEFETFVALKTLSFEDLYGGKLCAALDRQHPRDLFDVRLLLKKEGITDGVRRAFIGYLISHSRPMHELLNPNTINIEDLYYKEFEGMTEEEDILNELINVQRKLPVLLLNQITDKEKEFLISFKKGNPDWLLISLPGLEKLPGVKWKLLNISKMNVQKHEMALEKLKKVLRS